MVSSARANGAPLGKRGGIAWWCRVESLERGSSRFSDDA